MELLRKGSANTEKNTTEPVDSLLGGFAQATTKIKTQRQREYLSGNKVRWRIDERKRNGGELERKRKEILAFRSRGQELEFILYICMSRTRARKKT